MRVRDPRVHRSRLLRGVLQAGGQWRGHAMPHVRAADMTRSAAVLAASPRRGDIARAAGPAVLSSASPSPSVRRPLRPRPGRRRLPAPRSWCGCSTAIASRARSSSESKTALRVKLPFASILIPKSRIERLVRADGKEEVLHRGGAAGGGPARAAAAGGADGPPRPRGHGRQLLAGLGPQGPARRSDAAASSADRRGARRHLGGLDPRSRGPARARS